MTFSYGFVSGNSQHGYSNEDNRESKHTKFTGSDDERDVKPYAFKKPYEQNRDASRKPYGQNRGFPPARQEQRSRREREPITKNVYKLSEITAQRSQDEVMRYMQDHEVSVVGDENIRPVLSFEELNVPHFVMKPIKDNRFDKPTPIQAQSWPIALSGHDMVGIAQTGSGKTYGFMVPAIVHISKQRLSSANEGPTVLIMCPTRELCQQIAEVGQSFAHAAGYKMATIYGGAAKGPQIGQLRRGVDIVIATPGRLLDLMNMRVVNMERVSYVVLDEADRMLDMGFEPQIKEAMQDVRHDRQTLMFSATWPKEVHRLANEFLSEFYKINIGADDLHANHKIEQNIHMIAEHEKVTELTKLLDGIMRERDNKTIIFVETKKKADNICRELKRSNFPAVAIHGDKSQNERDAALSDFKTGRRPVMVATDVASRGIDVHDIRYVINFDYPGSSEDYVHRIGRTARSNASGVSHTFFTPQNKYKAKELVKVLIEAGQRVPFQLAECAKCGSGPPSSFRSRYRGNGRGGSRPDYNKSGRPGNRR